MRVERGEGRGRGPRLLSCGDGGTQEEWPPCAGVERGDPSCESETEVGGPADLGEEGAVRGQEPV